MIDFITTIHKFGQNGDKTGWTYIEIPSELAEKMSPGTRKSFRVRGKLDGHAVKGLSLLPMGAGNFMLALKADLRKKIGKGEGAQLRVRLQVDKEPFQFNQDFLDCLEDDPSARDYFKSLADSHQRYFSKWIDDAKTIETRTRRIAMAANALARGKGYGEMIRESTVSRKN